MRFSTTRLRPGYDEQEVDAFLDEAKSRLPVACRECGAQNAEAAQYCAVCGAPVAGQRSVAAQPETLPDAPAAQRAGSLAGVPWLSPAWGS
jgi:DivIVA domain-containing protein